MRARHLQLLAGLVAFGALLRFLTLDVQSYWLDEAATVNLMRKGFGSMVSGVVSGESTPPLYYIVAWGWAKLFGTGEVGLRSLSAVFGTLTIPVAFVLGRRVADERAGLIAAALVAFNPLLVWYSQEARSYALMVLLAGLSLIALLRAVDERSPRHIVWWVVCSVAAIATHYFAGFLIGAEALWLLYRYADRRAAAVAVAVVTSAGAALLPLALHQRSTGAAAFISQRSLGRRLVEIPKQFALGYHGPVEVIALVLAGLVLAYAAYHALASPARDRVLGFGAIGVVAIALPFLLALIGPDYLIGRNVLAAWLPLGVTAAVGLAAARRGGIAAVAVLCAIGLTMAIAVDVDDRYQRDDWRGAAEALGKSGQPRAIIVTPPSGRIPLLLYLNGARQAQAPGVDVRELDMVGLAPRLPGQAPNPPRPPVIAINQFTEFARKQADTFTVVREGSAQKQHIEPQTGASPLDGRPGVTLYQPSPLKR